MASECGIYKSCRFPGSVTYSAVRCPLAVPWDAFHGFSRARALWLRLLRFLLAHVVWEVTRIAD